MAKASKQPKPIDFEKSMHDLEALVEKMEKGEFSLEESIAQFERGIELARGCQQALKAAEQKVQLLSVKGEQASLESFDLPESD